MMHNTLQSIIDHCLEFCKMTIPTTCSVHLKMISYSVDKTSGIFCGQDLWKLIAQLTIKPSPWAVTMDSNHLKKENLMGFKLGSAHSSEKHFKLSFELFICYSHSRTSYLLSHRSNILPSLHSVVRVEALQK